MGYFDAVTSVSSFRITADGRKVFFPWGVLGRGYATASERDYRRLRQQVKLLSLGGLLLASSLVNGPASLKGYLTLAFPIVLLLYLSFYLVWLRYWLPRLQPSNERVERMSLPEGTHFTAFLEIFALGGVSSGILIFIFDPGRWLVALASIISGFLAVFFALRRRA
jgi:hypothetical protein